MLSHIRLATQTMQTLSAVYTELSRWCYYWGAMPPGQACDKLACLEDGSFLVRDSSSEACLFTVSYKAFGTVWHCRINHCPKGFFLFEFQVYQSVVELIEDSVLLCSAGKHHLGMGCTTIRGAANRNYPLILRKGVSRATGVPSLQYWCRFVIREHTRKDYIDRLPLPPTVIDWIRENKYLQMEL